jgi:hypothetical protein
VPFAMLHILWLMFRRKLFMTEQIESGVRSFLPDGEAMFTMVKMLTNIFFQ